MASLLRRAVQRLNVYLSVCGGYVILAMMALTTLDVLGRSLFRHPIPGAYELSEYMLAVAVLLGIAYAQQIERHAIVPLVVAQLRPRNRLFVETFVTILGLIFFSLMTWQGAAEAMMAYHDHTASEILRVPVYPFKGLISVGSFLLCLELLFKLADNARKLVHKGMNSKEG